VARVRNGGHEKPDVEAHTLKVEWEKQDLEELLHRTSGDAISLRFDRTELEQALEEGDVEAHGLREKALVLSVAAATAAGISGQAAARVAPAGGAGAVSASAPISDVVSGGPTGAQAPSETPLVSDVVSGGPAGAQAPSETPLVSDVVSGGPAGAQAPSETPLVSDVVSGGPAGAQAPSETPLVSDVVSGGPAGAQAPSETPLVSDVVSGGPAPSSATVEPSGGGGISVSAPEALGAGLAGGLALLITGASFAVRRQRRGPAPA
jgi:hypothetical protein